ncbi:ParB-like partition protein [Alteracholeplasma palmae J233]|uniref:ParB-like partition protein n=1 Tax=Alteracholeplasma palmae (strain ATCC 49389 / J233) TaxID=1318466 RepID=U4KLS7_ALTPJ|nr:ParB/RepB/Spo0J family partition protein [Alteracholeplasma palmae]CCV64934.1 ParB-like partition protein [Alteracholeplasma palmae J233]
MKPNNLKPRKLEDLIKEHHIDEVLEGEVVLEVELSKIKPNPFQPRRIFNPEKIRELANSIEEHGVFQPIILKTVKEGYIIVSGERRFRASQLVGKKTIPAIIRAYQEDKVAEIALVENLQREDLTAIEEAEAYLNIMKQLEITQNDLAIKIGKSRSHVTNMLGLLNLPAEVQQMMLENKLSMGHARALSKLEDSEKIIQLAKKIINENLSVRQIEELTQRESKAKKIKVQRKPEIFQKYEKKIKEKYQVSAKIFTNKIVISKLTEEKINDIINILLKDDY